MPVIIRDGYVLTGLFPGGNGHPPVSFKYRPAVPEKVYEYQQSVPREPKARVEAVIKLLLDHVSSWDAEILGKDGKVARAPLDGATLQRTPAPILGFMLDCVCGYEAWEEDEKKSAAAS
jgi:hypothetical protein